MKKRVVVEPSARAELRDAALWYEAQRAGVGEELVAVAEGVFASLESGATTGMTVPGVSSRTRMRRVFLERFPYAIVYVEHEESVHVIAVAHFKRRPDYWKNRVRAAR